MALILPVAGGKGGVGKSTLAANLAVLLSQKGIRTTAVDLDLGAGNLHTFLGVKNSSEGVAAFIQKRVQDVNQLTIPTNWPNLSLIPGDGMIPGMTNLSPALKRKLFNGLKNLNADMVILDLGPGSGLVAVDAFLSAPCALAVTAPETTAVLNTYTFFKAVSYRLLYLSQPPRSEVRQAIDLYMHGPMEGSGKTLQVLFELVREQYPQALDKLVKAMTNFHPGVALNGVRSPEERMVGEKLAHISEKNLGFKPYWAAELPWDDVHRSAINNRVPYVIEKPQAPWTLALNQLADQLISRRGASQPELFWDEDTL